MKNQTVIGVFDTKTQAQNARQALTAANFDDNYIDISSYGEKGVVGKRYETDGNSVSEFFSDLFGTDNDTGRRYADVASRGTVVTVYTDTMAQAKQAAAILDQYGSIDFDDRCSTYAASNGVLNDNTIKVIEESIAVGKREVETGSATVRSRIIEKPVQETLRLREEHIVIERNAVDRPATAADFETHNVTLTETAEEAVVAKDARVVEEISINKEVDTRTETIHETVRETEVDVIETEGEVVRKYDDTVV